MGWKNIDLIYVRNFCCNTDNMTDTGAKAAKESKKEKRERKVEKKLKTHKKTEKLVAPTEDDGDEEDIITLKASESSEDVGDEDNADIESKQKEYEEIAIDLQAGVPLSKKQSRLLKKGKLDLEKLAKKNVAPKPILTEEEQAVEDAKKTKKSEFGVWIGNLSFDTTREDLIRFVVAKSSHFSDDETLQRFVKVEESDITRVNIPKKENKIKGFAYLDLPSLAHVELVVSMSESVLNGRKLLIKNAHSFEGRPAVSATPLSKNPPSRILFVGNLSFDTTEDNLEEHFRHCGDIMRVRMATFEDTGKCKGFAFIDFRDEEGPTTALKSNLAKHLINRPLRMEYGEDRSKRTPNHRRQESQANDTVERPTELPQELFEWPVKAAVEKTTPSQARVPKPAKKRVFAEQSDPNKRLKSSVALATAQRASAAIVPSSGKKIKFD